MKTPALEDRMALALAQALVRDEVPQGGTVFTDISGSLQWERFHAILAYHEMLPFAHSIFDDWGIRLPDPQEALLKKAMYQQLFSTASLWQEARRLCAAVSQHDKPCVPLKGIAYLAEKLYGDRAFLRPMVDIDVLVRREDLDFMEGLLIGLGYQKELCGYSEEYWKNHGYHIAFRKQTGTRVLLVEVHWALDYPGKKPAAGKAWRRTSVRSEEENMSLLSPEDTFICQALHQRRFGKILCLKNVCDAALLLKKYRQVLDWDYMIDEARRGECRATLFFLLSQCRQLCGVSIPRPLVKKLAVPRHQRRWIEHFIVQNITAPHVRSNSILIKISS